MQCRSPRGTSSSVTMAFTSFSTGTLSPVRAASSALMLALSRMRQSAGTASPASRITMSPGTSTSLRSRDILPSRSTLLVAAVISWRASMAFSALLSWYTPRTALMSTTIRIINTSVKLSPE